MVIIELQRSLGADVLCFLHPLSFRLESPGVMFIIDSC